MKPLNRQYTASSAEGIIRRTLAPLQRQPGLTKGLVAAAVDEAYDPSRGGWWRREWDSAKRRVLKELFPQWFGGKREDDAPTLFTLDRKDNTSWSKK